MYKRSSRFGKSRFKKNKAPAAKTQTKFFSIFNPHNTKAPLFSVDIHPTKGRFIQVGSIDPGIYHFSLRCERWYEDNSIEKIEYCLIDFTKPKNKDGSISGVGKENFYYINSIAILEEYCNSFLQECHYICIESQLSWAYDMVRLSSHIIAILCVFLKNKGNRPLIIELDPRLKSRLLGRPPGMKKKDLKKSASGKAREF